MSDDPDDESYPATIPGCLTLRTGDRIALTAHRTEEIDARGCRVYQLTPDTGDRSLPITEADYLAGGIGIEIETVPGLSAIRFGFTRGPERSVRRS